MIPASWRLQPTDGPALPGRRVIRGVSLFLRRALLPILLRLLLPSLLLPLFIGCGTPSHGETERPRSLVLIVMDTVRGDRLGAAGYPRAVTPHLDSLAASGTRFADAMTPVPVTLPAVASLLTGRLPIHHGVRDNGCFALHVSERTLAEELRDAGWRTAAVVASEVLAAEQGLHQGFETYDDDFQGPYAIHDPDYALLADEFAANRRRADSVTDRALERLASFGGDEPFFLLVHYFDAHMYHDPPPEHAVHHADSPYDGEITFIDHEIGRLLARVGERADALTVVVGDHGESLGEHGEPQHGFLLYQSTLHVPWIVSGPGVPAGLVRADPVSLVDLVPTLRRVLDLPEDGVVRDGRALQWDRAETEPRPLYAETFHPLTSYAWSELRAVRMGDWKLIRGAGVTELYDLGADAAEQQDRLRRDPASGQDRGERTGAEPEWTAPVAEQSVSVKEWNAALEELTAALEKLARQDDPEAVLAASRGTLEPDRRAALESLGYLVASDPDHRPPGGRPHPLSALPAWQARQLAKTLFRHASHRIDAGEMGVGVAMLDSVLTLQPDLADAYFERGKALQQLGEETRADRDLERSMELKRKQMPVVASLLGSPGQAAGGFAEVEVVEALEFITHSYLLRGAPGDALPHLRLLVTLRPDDAGALYNLGLAAYRIGHEDEARRHLRRYLEQAPERHNAELVRHFLDEMLGG